MSTLDRLQEETPTQSEFGKYEEEAIVSLALDYPEMFTNVSGYIKPEMFERLETQYVIGEILNHHEKFGIIPTRPLLREVIERKLKVEEPFQSILAVLDRRSNTREVPVLRDRLVNWARAKSYGLIYTPEAQDAYLRGDYAYIEKLINEAARIADVSTNIMSFFDQLETFLEPAAIEHRTTGFGGLDRLLNNGGPSPKEVVLWMAATNVGKSIMLCNNAITSLQGMGSGGQIGQNVLLVTFELDAIKTALRCIGVATAIDCDKIYDHVDYIKRVVSNLKTQYQSEFDIVELPPDECSVDNIYATIDYVKRQKGWRPDVVIIDYLELMRSRHASNNDNGDYTKQKAVANEVRGLAKNENVLVFTATQTNRSAVGSDKPIDLDKMAESFGKSMPTDYVITLNQTAEQRNASPPLIELFVAKNRNGPKNSTIRCSINYNTMQIKELL